MVPWRSFKKLKKGSKNSVIVYFRSKIDVFSRTAYFQSDTADMSLIAWETKKLGRFFVKNWLFGLKYGVFVKKSKNRPKNRVFGFLGPKYGSFSFSVKMSPYAAYKKLISQKTKKLGRFFGQNQVFSLKLRNLVKKRKTGPKIVILIFGGWNRAHLTAI